MPLPQSRDATETLDAGRAGGSGFVELFATYASVGKRLIERFATYASVGKRLIERFATYAPVGKRGVEHSAQPLQPAEGGRALRRASFNTKIRRRSA